MGIFKLTASKAKALKTKALRAMASHAYAPTKHQRKAASEIIDLFIQKKQHVFLWGLLQSGKTGTLIAVCHIFARISKGKNPLVLYISNISDNELLGQCVTRLELADLTGATQNIVKIYHLGQLRNGSANRDEVLARLKDSDEVLIILDEGHWGTRKGGVLDSLFFEAGIDIRSYVNESNVFVLWASATLQQMQSARENGFESLTPVRLDVDPSYIGLTHLRDSGLLRPAEMPFFRKTKKSKIVRLSDFTEEVITRFLEDYDTKGPGYALLRVKNTQDARLLKKLLKKRGVTSGIYHCKSSEREEYDIKKLYDHLQRPPQRPHALIICRAMGAGKTLTEGHRKNLLVHVDFKGVVNSKAGESIVQSPGRHAGYNVGLDYPIYCQMDLVDQYIERVEAPFFTGTDITSACSGTYVEAAKQPNQTRVVDVIAFTGKEAEAIVNSRSKDRPLEVRQISRTSKQRNGRSTRMSYAKADIDENGNFIKRGLYIDGLSRPEYGLDPKYATCKSESGRREYVRKKGVKVYSAGYNLYTAYTRGPRLQVYCNGKPTEEYRLPRKGDLLMLVDTGEVESVPSSLKKTAMMRR